MKRFLTCQSLTALFVLIATGRVSAQLTQHLEPIHDCFVREAAPEYDFGAAGALNISGPAAVNPFGMPMGQFQTVMKFDTSSAVQAFDDAFGAGSWTISSIALTVYGIPDPNNPIFNIGEGSFEIRWLSADNWTEGNGTPGIEEIGSGDQMTWNYLQTLLASASETSLGTFVSMQTVGSLVFQLPNEPVLVADLSAGGPTTLHFVAVDEPLGFTFNSHNYLVPQRHPFLSITAAPMTGTPGDLDGDSDVDLADYLILHNCLAGPAAPVPAGCAPADLNASAHVDIGDFAQFENAFTGP